MSAPGSSVMRGASRWLAAPPGVTVTASASPATARPRQIFSAFMKSSILSSVRRGPRVIRPYGGRPATGCLPAQTRAWQRRTVACYHQPTDPVRGSAPYLALEEEYSVRSGQTLAAVHPQKDDLGTLIGRAARGDESALASLYDSTAALVNGLALRILRDRGAAEEVTGDVYLQVWRQAVRYDESRGSALSWLLTLARTRAIDRLRSGANQRARTEPLRAAFAIPSTAPDPEEHSHLS